MRVVVVLLSFLFVAPLVNAQTPATTDSSDVQLVKFSWSKERLNWERNPFGGPNENFHQMQFRARSEKRVTDAKRAGNSAEISKLEKDAKTDAAIVAAANQQSRPPRYYFFYKASIRNTSTKAIAEIDWDYVFFDETTGDELDRREFTSVQKIAPGKEKELTFTLNGPLVRGMRRASGSPR